MKISKKHHIRKEGPGTGKLRLNPRKDNPQPLSRITELKRLKNQELSEKEVQIKPIQLPELPSPEMEAYNKKLPGINKSPKEILYFEIGTICGNCSYPVGPNWIITDTQIICPRCKHKKERSSWSGGKS